VIQEFFFHGVPVEPGDSAQPARHGGAGAAPGFQVTGEAFDVGAADGEQDQGAGTAPRSELPQVEGIGLSCQAPVPGQEPGEREPLGIAECGLDGTRAVVEVAVIGYLPVLAETVEAGPAGLSNNWVPPSSALLVTCCHGPQCAKLSTSPEKRSKSPTLSMSSGLVAGWQVRSEVPDLRVLMLHSGFLDVGL